MDILGYIIQFNVNGGFYSTLASPTFGTNGHPHSGLIGGQTYTYQMVAVNKYGPGLTYSVPVSF